MALWGKKPPVIDAHIHTHFSSEHWKGITEANRVPFTQEGLIDACNRLNIVNFAAIHDDMNKPTPVYTKNLPPEIESKMLRVGVITPKITTKQVKKTEELLKNGTLRALKVYSGKYPVFCYDKRFHPFYKLAEKYEVPVYIHTGDTIGKGARLKYAHPLHADEAAVDFPGTNFILTQLGNPWMVNAAEVAYKNANVYLDTAGLFVGMLFDPLMQARIKYIVDCVENPRKILYGSDWPITHMHTYFSVMKKLFPVGAHERIFYKNAKELFKIK